MCDKSEEGKNHLSLVMYPINSFNSDIVHGILKSAELN